MKPELLFTLLCDDVREERSGKLVIVGLYNYDINFLEQKRSETEGAADQPESGSTGKQKFGLPQLCLVRRWKVDSPGHKTRTEFIGPKGKILANVERELIAQKEGIYYQEIIRILGPILEPGKYTIRTTLDETVSNEYFEVRAKPPSQSAGESK